MSKRFPDRLDPWRFADLGKEVNGEMPLDVFSRLRDILLKPDGKVCFELRFSRDERRRARLDGEIRTQLSLECQRCLGELILPVDRRISVVFVQGLKEAEMLPEDMDPCLVEEGMVVFSELIEDELLLALPQVSMHDRDICQIPRELATNELSPIEIKNGEQERENPFAVLAGLKRDKH
ncbi:MAG: YceD family protein [Candidatus Thiodiazotropha sp.]|jgi:uncharacterized protein